MHHGRARTIRALVGLICSVKLLFCLIGVAHYQAMCSRESSCLVVVDRGFGTADIIAHEIGHQYVSSLFVICFSKRFLPCDFMAQR